MSTVRLRRSRPEADRTLTQRAGLTAAASVLRQGARVLAALIVTPLVLRAVGVEEWGIWLVVQQSVGLLVVADLRATGTLKFTLAIRQHDDDHDAKRRQVGASLIFWALTLPVVLLVTGVAGWVLPYVIDVPADLVTTTRVVFFVTMGAVLLDRLLSTPGLMLRGVNLDYAGMGLDAVIILAGGFLGLAAVEAGFGLVGFAVGSMAGVLLADVARGVIAWRRIPWFGADRPSRAEVREFAGHSGWLALGDVAGLLLFGAELILVGAVAGATAAAVFGATQFAVRTVSGPLVELLASAGPGVARLVGEGLRDRALGVRANLLVLGLGAAVAVGSAVLVVNQAFVDLWVGSSLYGGTTLNILLVVLAVVTVLIRVDSLIVDACLGFRARSSVTLVGAVIGVLAGLVLGHGGSVVGATTGLLLGRVAVLVVMPVLVARATGADVDAVVRPLVRPGVVGIALLGTAAVVGASVTVPATWAAVVVAAAMTTGLAGAVYVLVGADGRTRRDLVGRVLLLAGRAPEPMTGARPA